MPQRAKNSAVAGLNEGQVRAVTFGEGPLLVVAGAGSGKTRVITHRIAWLIEKGIPPGEILAITFTNKAASEMAQRVAKMACGGVTVKTFHAFCAALLRRNIQHLGRDGSFTIYDRDDSLRIVRRICKALQLDLQHYKPGDILERISAHKDRLETSHDALQNAVSGWDEQAARIYARYETELAENNALDFDDLLMSVVRLFDQHPRVLARCQARCRYLLVDEYQDTNYAQNIIARALQGKYRNITAVGDPDQMIYTWRGARLENIMNFDKNFPGTTIIKLERNYRSTSNILRAASHTISFNTLRYEKRLYTETGPGNPVEVVGHANARMEAEWTAEAIRNLLDTGAADTGIGVLYRTRLQSGEFEAALARRGIPFQLVDTIGIFERKAIKDIAAYLHLLLNPKDGVALRRIINVPARGVGPVTIRKIERAAEKAKRPALETILEKKHLESLPARAKKAAGRFAGLYRRLQSACMEAGTIRGAVQAVIDETGYLKSVRSEDREEIRELLDYFLGFAEQYQRQNPGGDLVSFMEQSVLASGVDGWKREAGGVSLLTLHSAKGLEFDTVFLTGVENGILPHTRAIEEKTGLNEEDAIEEERRLFHVGMTRARKRLYVTYACERMIKGRYEPTGESGFLTELPCEGVKWKNGHAPGMFRSRPGRPDGSLIPQRKDGYENNSRKRATQRNKRKAPADKGRNLTSAQQETDGMKPGMKIKHEKYGEGTLVSVSEAGNRKLLRINFPGCGVLSILQ